MLRLSFHLLLITPCLALAQVGLKPGPVPNAATKIPDDPPPRGAVLRVGSLRLAQGGNVRGLAFRRDGKVLYSCGDDSPLRAWDVATGRELPALAGVTGVCPALALSRDGRTLAAAGQDCIRLISLDTGKVQLECPLAGNVCTGLTIAPDGKSLAWFDGLRQVHLHDFATNKELRVLKSAATRMNPNYDVLANMGWAVQINPAFAPDGKTLAAPTSDGAVLLWEVATGKRLRAYLPTFDDQRGMTNFTGAFFGRDGKTLHTVGIDGKVRAWERDSLEEKSPADVAQEAVPSVALSPDGKTAAGVTPQGNVHLWNVENGKAVAAFKAEEGLSSVAFSADGKTLATGGNNGALRLWEVATGKELLMPGVRRAFLAVGFADGGKKLVTVSKNSVGHWSAGDGKLLKEVNLTSGKPALAKLSPTGKHAFVTLDDQQMRLLDTDTGQLKEGPRESWQHQFNVSAFSPAGDLLALSDGQDPRSIKLWDTATGKERRAIKYEGASVGSVVAAFSPDGRTLLTGHPTRGLMECHELATGARRRPARLPANLLPDQMGGGAMMYFPNGVRLGYAELVYLPGATFAPNSRHLAIPSGLRIGLAELATGRLVRWFDGADKPVVTMAFSPDGRWLAATGMDRVVRLWDARTGHLRASVEGHRGNVPGLAFAPDGKRFVSAGDDGTLVVRDVEAVQRHLVARASAPTTRPFENLWRDLASDDAAIAEKAMAEMVANPIVTIPELKTRLKPVPPVDPATLAKLIEELDSNVADARERATKQLEEMDTMAAKALKAAADSPSAEVKKRVARLLERLDKTRLPGVEARPLRAVEALEQIVAPGAAKLLEGLAKGAADARLTRDAEAAAARLRLRGEP